MAKSPTQIIYVEDDASTAEVLILYLEQQGHKVFHYRDGLAAHRALINLNFDLAIFDIMLPNIDGKALLSIAVEKSIPSIMVTAKVAEDDRIEGFDLGADDYVCKPYSPRELTSRVNALLKRSHRGHQIKKLTYSDIEIDLDAKQAFLRTQPLTLTGVEFDLLATMANKPNHVFSRAQLLEQIWHNSEDVTERAIDTHLANLRKKLGDSKQEPKYIATRYGQGYVFIAQGENNEA